jgi:hypothetical protein
MFCLLVAISVARTTAQITVHAIAGLGNQLRVVNGFDYLARRLNTSLALVGWHFDEFFIRHNADGAVRHNEPPLSVKTGWSADRLCALLRHENRSLLFTGYDEPNFARCFPNTDQYEQTAHLNVWLRPNLQFASSVPAADYGIHARTCVDCGWQWSHEVWTRNVACILRQIGCPAATRRRVYVAADSHDALMRLKALLVTCGHEVLTNESVCPTTKFVHSERTTNTSMLACVMFDWYALAKAAHIIASGTTFSITAAIFQTDPARAVGKNFTSLHHKNLTTGCERFRPLFK